MHASVPPASIASPSPRRMISAASPIGVRARRAGRDPAKFGPRIPSEIASCPLAESTSTLGMK